ncbi:Fatty acid desaturase domain-containing protein [Nostoc sp. DSM 114161]|jgi:fatty acid desaturase|uniref:fatty acid desaturase n=1 Tax=Nostoc sp. DSM 114161 TaxID=3440143 RepID=UPI004045685F
MTAITTISIVEKQTVKLVSTLLIWLVYLFFLPYIYASLNIFSLLFMLFPGVYLLCLLAQFMHECWHEYLPRIDNKLFYLILSWIIFLDPQTFNIVHPFHHSQVNTYNDIEFHPLGEIKNKPLRIIYNLLEICLGNIFILIVASFQILQHPKLKQQYCLKKLIISIVMRIFIWGGVGYTSHLLLGVTTGQIIISYLITCWMGSFMVHHCELIEHGNLIVEGDLKERNLQTRNLKPCGILEKVFLFITHNHCLEHSLHHSMSNTYTRPFPQTNVLPENTVYISLAEYLVILKDMLIGKCLVINSK